jgi:hypothetical protein
MSVLGEFHRIGDVAIAGLEGSGHVALKALGRELAPLREARDVDLAAAAGRVLALIERTREELRERQDPGSERLEAETDDLRALCRIILGHG